MPKQKTHKSTAKRYRTTGSGRLLRKRAGRRHLLRKKSASAKRRLAIPVSPAPVDEKKIRQIAGK